jgi:hypothetical protein
MAEHRPRQGRSVSPKELRAAVAAEQLEPEEAQLLGELDQLRPRVRGDCEAGERPCPWVGCKFHLYLDVTPAGSIKENYPDRGPEALGESCALDLADRGGMTLEAVGDLLGLTRERIRQVERQALARAAAAVDEDGSDER